MTRSETGSRSAARRNTGRDRTRTRHRRSGTSRNCHWCRHAVASLKQRMRGPGGDAGRTARPRKGNAVAAPGRCSGKVVSDRPSFRARKHTECSFSRRAVRGSEKLEKPKRRAGLSAGAVMVSSCRALRHSGSSALPTAIAQRTNVKRARFAQGDSAHPGGHEVFDEPKLADAWLGHWRMECGRSAPHSPTPRLKHHRSVGTDHDGSSLHWCLFPRRNR